MALLVGTTEGVAWKVGIILNDGAMTPIFEFSGPVPHDHPAVMEAYTALLRCVQQVLGDAWTSRAMCPLCHLPSAAPAPCECCDQKMCQMCRLRHARGQGIPGTGEPSGAGSAPPDGSGDRRPRPGPLPGYA